jgi:DNA-binding MarR family transcriptional regulator
MSLALHHDPIVCACTNLKIAGRSAGRAWDDALAPAGVNHTQYAILINILRRQPVTAMTLVELLSMDRTTLYRAVSVLQRQGLVTCEPSGHGKTLLLQLTPQGRKTTDQAWREWRKIQQRFIETFGVDRWDEFLHSLRAAQDVFASLLELTAAGVES